MDIMVIGRAATHTVHWIPQLIIQLNMQQATLQCRPTRKHKIHNLVLIFGSSYPSPKLKFGVDHQLEMFHWHCRKPDKSGVELQELLHDKSTEGTISGVLQQK